jgi:PKD repeat protein
MALASLRDFVRALQILSVFLLLASPISASVVNVLTQHNDSFRTGANLSEYVLTVSNVSTSQFGKLFSRVVDGQIYAQPLYVSGLTISNKLHNVVYVATEHNSVYAFDADDPAASNALWHVNLGTSVPIADINGCGDLQPEVGITSTPAIDLTSNTMYVDAKTKVGTNHFQQLHALDLLTGQEKLGGPVAIQGSVPGTGTGSVGGTLAFDPLFQHSRAGLLLLSNTVYVAFGSHCDFNNYHGWLFGYNATNLQQTSIFCTTPNAGSDNGGGGIWGSGTGPAADTDGNIYVTTGNGTLDKDTGGLDLGDSLIKLSVSNGTLVVADWFSPHDQAHMFTNDLDLAAGGPVVIPGTSLLVLIGKTGAAYLIDRQHLGGFVSGPSDTNIVQEFTVASNTFFVGQSLIYWNGPTNQFLFFWTHGIPVKAYSFNGTSIATNPVAIGSTTQSVDRVGGISLSANGNTPGSGILWGTEPGSGGTVHAYDASNVANELWNSQQMASRDALGNYTKFCAPTIANGKVYVTTTSSNLVVYGLLGTPSQGVSPASYDFGTLATGTTAQTSFVVTNTGGGELVGTVATAGPFTIVSGNSYSMAGGGSTNAVVSFTAPSPGSFSNSVVFTSNGGVSTNPVTGTGLTPPYLSVSPGSLNYGSLVIGQTSNQFFSVINTGQVTLTGTATVGLPFAAASNASYSVAGGATGLVLISFSPSAAGAVASNVVFTSTGGVSTNAVSGAGLTPANLMVNLGSLNFGTIATGTTAQATFVVTNSGGALLSGTAVAGGAFTISSGSPYNVPGLSTANVVINFTPLSVGSFSTNVVFASNGGNSTNVVSGSGAAFPAALFSASPTNGAVPLTVTFADNSTGTITNRFWSFGDGATSNLTLTTVAHTYNVVGISTVRLIVSGLVGDDTNTQVNLIVAVNPPQLMVSPASRNFGTVVVGQASNQFFSVINTGGLALTGSATVAGAPYSITAGSPFAVAPGQTQNVTVAFVPVAAGTFSTNLIVASNGGASTNALTGVSVTPAQLAVSPLSWNFGVLATGGVAYASFAATNSGGAPLSGTASVGLPFAVVTNGSFSVAGFASTNVVVQFAPATTGTWTSNVVFTSTGGSSTNAVSGIGLTPGSIAVTPATLNFGALGTGTTAQASFVVTNSGGIAVSNGTAIVSGGPFSIVSGAAFSVSGLGSTNVVVQFAPVSAGGFTNSVVFTTANGGNVTNTVSGAGAVAPVASFTAHPTGGAEPLGVTFSDTSTGTQPLTLYWNLGDSVLVTNSGGANFNHTYAAGTYTVALTASNAIGTSTLVSNNLISVVTALQAWQLHYFGCTNCAQAQPSADPDGTGMSNTNRFLAGFNPTNPAAYPHIISIANTNTTDINVIYLGANGDNTWSPGIASRTNVLELTAGMAGGGYSSNFVSANVTNILGGGAGTGIVTNMIDAGGATNSPSRYYRVRVLVP